MDSFIEVFANLLRIHGADFDTRKNRPLPRMRFGEVSFPEAGVTRRINTVEAGRAVRTVAARVGLGVFLDLGQRLT